MAAKRTVLQLDTATGLKWYIDRSVLEGRTLARKRFKAEIKEGQWQGHLVDEVDDADVVVVDAATGDLFGLHNADAFVVSYDYFAAVERRRAIGQTGRPTLADFAVNRPIRDALEQGSKLYVDRTVGADAPGTRQAFLEMLVVSNGHYLAENEMRLSLIQQGDEWRARIVHDHFDSDYNIVDPAIVDVAGFEKSKGLCLGCDYFTAAARLKDSGKPVQATKLQITAFTIANRAVIDEQTYGPKPLDAEVRETPALAVDHAGHKRPASSDGSDHQESGEVQSPSRKRPRRATATAAEELPEFEDANDGADANTQSDDEEIDKLHNDEDEKQVGRTRGSESPGPRTASERSDARSVPLPPSPLFLRKGFGNEEVLSWMGQLLGWAAETKTAATFGEAIEHTSRFIPLFDANFYDDSFENFVKYVHSGQQHSGIYAQLVAAYDRGANGASGAPKPLVPAEPLDAVRAAAVKYKAAHGHLYGCEVRPALRPCPDLKPRNASQSTHYTEEGKQWLEDAARYFIAGGGFPMPQKLGELIYAQVGADERVTQGGIASLLHRAKSSWLGKAYDEHIRGSMEATWQKEWRALTAKGPVK